MLGNIISLQKFPQINICEYSKLTGSHCVCNDGFCLLTKMGMVVGYLKLIYLYMQVLGQLLQNYYSITSSKTYLKVSHFIHRREGRYIMWIVSLERSIPLSWNNYFLIFNLWSFASKNYLQFHVTISSTFLTNVHKNKQSKGNMWAVSWVNFDL